MNRIYKVGDQVKCISTDPEGTHVLSKYTELACKVGEVYTVDDITLREKGKYHSIHIHGLWVSPDHFEPYNRFIEEVRKAVENE